MANENSKTIYNVKKVKEGADGKKHYQEVGKLILRDSGSGVIYLHFLDGEFAVFPATKRDASASDGDSAAS